MIPTRENEIVEEDDGVEIRWRQGGEEERKAERRMNKKRRNRSINSTMMAWGLPYMTSAKCWDFFNHSPLVTYINQLILFLSSAFWGPPPSVDVTYGSPNGRQ